MSLAKAADDAADELQVQLKAQRQAIEELQSKVKAYQDKINAKRSEASTIKNQLSELEDQIDKTKTELEIKQAEITALNLSIRENENSIKSKNEEMAKEQERIAEFIRLLYQNNQKSYVEILLANDAFSEFFDQVESLKTLEENLGVILKKIKAVKTSLEIERENLAARRQELENLRAALTSAQDNLEDKVTVKNILLETTHADEAKFQALLRQSQAEQAQINSDIVSLERKLRERLAARGDKTLSELSGQGFMWPVDGRTITAGFHDPDYPFRRVFEHPAIDIRAKQGTPIRAIGSGYVSQAHDAGMGYSYISLIHADGLSSVYGHTSCILVKEDDYVVQGQVIGCSGATPGTPGAGRLTTGAHLHLEIRLNGIPVNPVDYLP